jgi:hypothetical protein
MQTRGLFITGIIQRSLGTTRVQWTEQYRMSPSPCLRKNAPSAFYGCVVRCVPWRTLFAWYKERCWSLLSLAPRCTFMQEVRPKYSFKAPSPEQLCSLCCSCAGDHHKVILNAFRRSLYVLEHMPAMIHMWCGKPIQCFLVHRGSMVVSHFMTQSHSSTLRFAFSDI